MAISLKTVVTSVCLSEATPVQHSLKSGHTAGSAMPTPRLYARRITCGPPVAMRFAMRAAGMSRVEQRSSESPVDDFAVNGDPDCGAFCGQETPRADLVASA